MSNKKWKFEREISGFRYFSLQFLLAENKYYQAVENCFRNFLVEGSCVVLYIIC